MVSLFIVRPGTIFFRAVDITLHRWKRRRGHCRHGCFQRCLPRFRCVHFFRKIERVMGDSVCACACSVCLEHAVPLASATPLACASVRARISSRRPLPSPMTPSLHQRYTHTKAPPSVCEVCVMSFIWLESLRVALASSCGAGAHLRGAYSPRVFGIRVDVAASEHEIGRPRLALVFYSASASCCRSCFCNFSMFPLCVYLSYLSVSLWLDAVTRLCRPLLAWRASSSSLATSRAVTKLSRAWASKHALLRANEQTTPLSADACYKPLQVPTNVCCKPRLVSTNVCWLRKKGSVQ